MSKATMKTKTMRGRPIDFNALMQRHAEMPALGNASVNARGDIIGANGAVVKKREDVARDYHRAGSKTVKRVALSELSPDVFASPAEALQAHKQALEKQQAAARAQAERAQAAVLTRHANEAQAANPKRKLTED